MLQPFPETAVDQQIAKDVGVFRVYMIHKRELTGREPHFTTNP